MSARLAPAPRFACTRARRHVRACAIVVALPITVAAIALAPEAASAQTIYRCGDRYSQSPCGPGATIVAAVAAPTPAQRAEAREVVAAEKRLASEMALDRRERERAIRPATASSLGPVHAAVAASAPARKHPAPRHKRALPQDGDAEFVAAVPKVARKVGG